MTLFECVDVEIAAKITHLNGKTNSKVITKEEKSTYKAKYCSTARTTVRMWWLCKFVCHFLDLLINSPEKELVPCVQEAYKDQFEPHHVWIVQKLAKQAMKWAGTRQQLKDSWGIKSFDEMKVTQEAMIVMRDALKKQLSDRECLELP